MFEIFASFVVGMTGSLHCLGMCGPLIIAWSLRYNSVSRTGLQGAALFPGAVFHHLAFHAGRIVTYGLLGAVVTGIFSSFEMHRFSMQYRAGFAIASGIVLAGLGLVIFGAVPLPAFITRLLSPRASFFGRKLAGLTNSVNPGSKMGLGLLVGLLPCGLSWAMLVAAAGTLNMVKGTIMMISFGLGTIPALFAAGASASLASAKTRLFGERTAAVFIILMGVSMALRGLGIVLGYGDHCGPMDLLSKCGLMAR
jgi:hypothetical protein